MAFLISNLLSESIVNFGKWSNRKSANKLICGFIFCQKKILKKAKHPSICPSFGGNMPEDQFWPVLLRLPPYQGPTEALSLLWMDFFSSIYILQNVSKNEQLIKIINGILIYYILPSMKKVFVDGLVKTPTWVFCHVLNRAKSALATLVVLNILRPIWIFSLKRRNGLMST